MDMNGNQNPVDVTQTPVTPVAPVTPEVAPVAPQAPASPAVDMAAMGLTGNAAPTPQTNGKKMNLPIIIGIAVVAVILLFVLLSPSGPEGVLNKYGNAIVNFDGAKLVDVIHPKMKEMIQESLDEAENEDYKTVEDLFKYILDESKDEGLEIKSFEVDKDFEEIEGDDLKEVAEDLKEDFDIDKDDVKAAREYTLTFEGGYDGELEEEEANVLIVQVGSNWYIFEDGFIIDTLYWLF